MTTAYTPARVFVQDDPDLSYEKIARTLECATTQIARYLRGDRAITPVMRTKLVREFGAKGEKLSDLCDETRRLRSKGIVSNDPAKLFKNTPAYVELARLGLSHDDFVARISLHRRRALRFLSGSLELTSEWRDVVLSEWGSSLVAAIDESHRMFCAEQDEKRNQVKTIDHGSDYRGPWFTMSEWREKFGEPGCSAASDLHGRVSGVFPTEPCFLGE